MTPDSFHMQTGATVESRNAVLAEAVGLTKAQISAIMGLTRWKMFLDGVTSADGDDLSSYFTTFGYTSNTPLAHYAKKGNPVPEEVEVKLRNMLGAEDGLQELGETIGVENPSIKDFINADEKTIKKEFPSLSISKIKLLQNFIKREIDFHTVELEDIRAEFPFPISQFNFFGRFIGGAEGGPKIGLRHLRSATPFFVALQGMLKRLEHDKRNFLVIPELLRCITEEEKASGVSPEQVKERREFLSGMIETCIDNSQDIFDDSDRVKMRCISLPKLPTLNQSDTNHIQQNENKRLAREIMDWVLFGDKSGELINRKSLGETDEKKLRATRRKIENHKKKLKAKRQQLRIIYTKLKDKPDDLELQDRKNLLSKVEIPALEKAQKEVSNTRDSLLLIKRSVKPIIQILEQETEGLEAFRKEVGSALEKEERIVFTAFENDSRSVFTDYFDLAYGQRRRKNYGENQPEYQSSDVLKNCSFIMSPIFEGALHTSRSSIDSFKSVLRTFPIDTDSMNPSVQYIITKIQAQDENMQINMLVEFLASGNMRIPGVVSRSDLVYFVRQETGKRNPTAIDYISYTFEHINQMNKDVLIVLLHFLKGIGSIEIPQRCRDIARERFHIPEKIFDQFEVYAKNFNPNTLGDIGGIFENRVSLQSYLNTYDDAILMGKEISEVQGNFQSGHDIISVVDSTSYHEELVGDVRGERIQEGEEKTDNIYGNYVRPSERLIRGLSLRIMEGNVIPELQDSSLVSVRGTTKASKSSELMIKSLFGTDVKLTPDLTMISNVLSDLHIYDEKAVIVINAENITDIQQLNMLTGLLKKLGLKAILLMREAIPGIPQVVLKPFIEGDITQRIMSEESSIMRKLGVKKPLNKEIVDFAVEQVKRARVSSDDPLNLVIKVLIGAIENARMLGEENLDKQDIIASCTHIFHLPDPEQMKSRIEAIEDFIVTAPLEVIGQSKAINRIAERMLAHMLGVRNSSRPLTLLLPGPTGVGKTELMMKLAKILNIPFFHVEGAEFSEPHTVARIVGSPTGYEGPDKGPLYTFMEDNKLGLVFIDEIEKMHPRVVTALINFFDTGTLTAGNGEKVRRPGFIIAGASNAGAEFLHKNMDENEVKKTLSEAFLDDNGKGKPELISRFDPIMMLAIEESEFKKIIELNLESIGKRHGIISANLEITEIDDTASTLLFNESKDICESESNIRGIGFKLGTQQVALENQAYNDMRHVSRALDNLLGRELIDTIIEQFSGDGSVKRGELTQIKLVGDNDNKKIRVEKVVTKKAA